MRALYAPLCLLPLACGIPTPALVGDCEGRCEAPPERPGPGPVFDPIALGQGVSVRPPPLGLDPGDPLEPVEPGEPVDPVEPAPPPPPVNDRDNDGVGDEVDNCPDTFNAGQFDEDLDGVGDECDLCPVHAFDLQANADDDWLGDSCDPRVNAPGDFPVAAHFFNGPEDAETLAVTLRDDDLVSTAPEGWLFTLLPLATTLQYGLIEAQTRFTLDADAGFVDFGARVDGGGAGVNCSIVLEGGRMSFRMVEYDAQGDPRTLDPGFTDLDIPAGDITLVMRHAWSGEASCESPELGLSLAGDGRPPRDRPTWASVAFGGGAAGPAPDFDGVRFRYLTVVASP